MSKSNPHALAASILHGKWAISADQMAAASGLVAKIIQGESPDFSGFKRPNAENREAGYTGYISPSGKIRYPWQAFDGAVEGSIGLVEISGTMLKADNCDDGMDTMTAYLYQCYQNPNITGVLLYCDSGGGQVMGTEAFAKAVADRTKPVVAWVNGTAASACYWVASQADKIIMNGQTSEVGSIGVMATVMDLIPYWEAQGVKFHTILAEGSEEKNLTYFELLKGNYDLVQAELTQIKDLFHSTVKSGRGDKLKNDSMLKGAMYPTKEAINLGMADAMGTMADAIKEIRTLAKTSTYSNSNSYTTANQMGGFSLFAKGGASTSASLFAKVAKAKKEELKADLVMKLNESLEAEDSPIRVVGESDFEAAMDGGTALNRAEERAEKAEARVKELEAEVKTLGDKIPNATGSQSTKEKEGVATFERSNYAYLTDEEFEDLKSGKLKI